MVLIGQVWETGWVRRAETLASRKHAWGPVLALVRSTLVSYSAKREYNPLGLASLPEITNPSKKAPSPHLPVSSRTGIFSSLPHPHSAAPSGLPRVTCLPSRPL